MNVSDHSVPQSSIRAAKKESKSCAPRTQGWQWTKSQSARRLFRWSRWLHVYVSTATLSLLVFFCITGLFLNHLAWFEDEPVQDGQQRIVLPQGLVQSLDAENPPLAEVQAFIQSRTGLRQPREVKIDHEFGEWTFDYPIPAGYVFVTLLVGEGVIELDYRKGSVVGILNDLHKGRHSGPVWSWVIDVSAILISFVALSGLVILFQQAKWRRAGLFWVMAGTLLPVLIYIFWVPKY